MAAVKVTRSTLYLKALLCLVGSILLQTAGIGATFTWTNNADGNWSVAANWNPNTIPNATTADTFFDSLLVTSDRIITLTAAETVNSMTFGSTNAYSFTAGSSKTLTINASAGTGLTQNGAGAVTFGSLPPIKLNNSQSWTGNGTGIVTVNGAFSVPNAGTHVLTKDGTFTLVLNAANSLDGFTINTGTVEFGNNTAAGANALTINGGTIQAGGAARNLANAVTVGGDFTIAGTNGLTLSGAVNLGSANRTITVTSTAAATVSGIISGTAGMTKTGSGTLSITAANSGLSGNILLNGGTLQMGDYQALGTGNLTISSNAELQASFANANNATLGNITINDGVIRRTDSSNVKSGFLSNTGTLTVNGNAQVIDQGGDSTGGFLTIDGTMQINSGGTLTLNAVTANDEVRLGGNNNIVIAAGATLATTGSGIKSIGSASARTIIATGTNGSEATFSIGNNTTAHAGTALQVNGAANINVNGLRIAGSGANVDNFLTQTRVQGITGSGGTLTIAYSDNASGTFTNAPTSASSVSLGFDAQGGSTPTYTLGAAVNDLQNWRGLVIKGGTVVAGADETFSASDSSLNMMGGTFKIYSVANGGQNITFKGNAYLTNGILDGGPSGGSHGTLIIGGNIVSSTNLVLTQTPNITMNPISKTNTVSGSGLNGIGNFTKDGTSDSEVILNAPITASGIYINQGTLLLGANNYIRGSPSLNLAGGTFHSGGYSNTFGVLTLTANSIINFGAGTNSFLTFANSSSLTNWTAGVNLTLLGWSGLTNGGGTEGIRFGTDATGLTSNQVAQIRFQDPAGFTSGTYPGSILANGEVVPVPETNTILAVLILALLIAYRERKSVAKIFLPALAKVKTVARRFKD